MNIANNLKYNVKILSIFPEVFPGSLDVSILAKARQKKIWDLNTVDLKKFSDIILNVLTIA